MARFDVPIRGYQQLQVSEARKIAKVLSVALADVIEELAKLNIKVTNDWSADRKENRDLVRRKLILIIEKALRGYDYEGYTDRIIDVSVEDHERRIAPLIFAAAIAAGLTRKDAKKRTDIMIKELRRVVDRTDSLFLGVDFIDNLTKLKKALPYRSATKLSNVMINDLRQYKKTGDEKYLKSAAKKLKQTRHYKNALYDATGDHFPDIHNSVYNGMAEAGLWTKHQWNSISPEDSKCKRPTGQIVRVGQKFNNGLIAPKVHPNCYCYLTPEGIII